jgi:hypothetical protein
MTEPAKNEAELLEQVVLTTCECQPGGCYLKDGSMLCCAEDDKVEAVFAAIRAAGWAVVPARLTKDMEYDALRAENARLREALEEIIKRDSYLPDGYGCHWRVWAEIAREALKVKP